MICRFIFALLVVGCGFPPILRAETPQAWVKANIADIVRLYQHFHAHPELSFHEKETAARLAEEWKQAGVDVSTDIGGHGVVGVIKNGDGPTLML